jgi:ribosomal protein S18 acetylase RimI-like enzyme/DNA-directed RNA polymerase subunit RPC12/RpoP
MGLAIAEVIPNFNEYMGASLLGGRSQMLRLLSTPTTSASLSPTPYAETIYTGAAAPTLRLYRCIQCRKKLRVGQGGNFETIELLKQKGCPECGTKRFRYKGRVGGKAKQEPEAPPVSQATAPSQLTTPSQPAVASQPAASSQSIDTAEGAIRPAREGDLEDLAHFEAEIARITFPEDPITSLDIHRKRLSKTLSGDRAGMFVLELDGRVAGWLWITMNTHFFTKERYATFRSLAVHPEVRGKDAARDLLRFAIEHSGSEGATWITGKVHVGNVPMRVLYSEMGFHAKHLTMEYRFNPAEEDVSSSGTEGEGT